VPGEFLTGSAAAAGIALVTSVANFGGFVGPYTVGIISQRTGNSNHGLICAGVSFLISAGLSLLLPKQAMLVSEHASKRAGAAFETSSEAV